MYSELWRWLKVIGQFHVLTALRREKEPPVPTEYEAGWAPESVQMLWRREKSCACA